MILIDCTKKSLKNVQNVPQIAVHCIRRSDLIDPFQPPASILAHDLINSSLCPPARRLFISSLALNFQWSLSYSSSSSSSSGWVRARDARVMRTRGVRVARPGCMYDLSHTLRHDTTRHGSARLGSAVGDPVGGRWSGGERPGGGRRGGWTARRQRARCEGALCLWFLEWTPLPHFFCGEMPLFTGKSKSPFSACGGRECGLVFAAELHAAMIAKAHCKGARLV